MRGAELKYFYPNRWLCLVVVFMVLLVGQPAYSATRSLITIDRNKRISAAVQEISIADILQKIGEKIPLRIIGNPPGEQVGLHVRGASLGEALGKIMRGYNYVLAYTEPPGTAVLTIMGKTERTRTAGGPVGDAPAVDSEKPEQRSHDRAVAETEPDMPGPPQIDQGGNQVQEPQPPLQEERPSEPSIPASGDPSGENKLEQGAPAPVPIEPGSPMNGGPLESARGKTQEASNTVGSTIGASPLGFLRKDTLDGYLNTKRS